MQGYSVGLAAFSRPAAVTPGRSKTCPEFTPVTSLSCQPYLVHFPKKVLCFLEAKQLQALEGMD